MHRKLSSLCIQLQESSIVLFVGAVLVPLEDQTILQTASQLTLDWWKSGSLNTSFHAQTLQGRNLSPKRTTITIEILANNPPTQQKRLLIPLSRKNICFLHACTPARRTPARLHWHTRSGNGQTVGYQTQKNISFKKRWEC